MASCVALRGTRSTRLRLADNCQTVPARSACKLTDLKADPKAGPKAMQRALRCARMASPGRSLTSAGRPFGRRSEWLPNGITGARCKASILNWIRITGPRRWAGRAAQLRGPAQRPTSSPQVWGPLSLELRLHRRLYFRLRCITSAFINRICQRPPARSSCQRVSAAVAR